MTIRSESVQRHEENHNHENSQGKCISNLRSALQGDSLQKGTLIRLQSIFRNHKKVLIVCKLMLAVSKVLVNINTVENL